jgi:hypothetical protein
MTATSSGRLRAAGKQVLLDGVHFADARDESAAQAIAYALDFVGVSYWDIPPEANKKMLEVLK